MGRRVINATMVRKCKHHGDTVFSQNSTTGYWQCLKCGNDRQNTTNRSLKQRMVDVVNGSCLICGYDGYIGALEFHHVNPATKSFEVNSRCKRSWDAIIEEIAKCVLLCSNCHKEVHAGVTLLTDRRYKEWVNIDDAVSRQEEL